MSLAALGLPPDANDEDVRDAYRRQVRARHPDHGGTPEAFRELGEWRDAALLEIHNRVCPACDGKGYISHGGGFSPMKMTCLECGGKG